MIATITPNATKESYNVVMEVTPELALKWLDGNTHNRVINQSHVNRLARDIRAGRFPLTHQGIAFDTTGLLINGQHRLWAIAEAGIPVSLRVFFNEPPEHRHVVDTGQRRTNLDILKITGHAGDATAKHLATLRAMLAGRGSRPGCFTPSEEIDQYRRHRDAVDFAVKHLGGSTIRGLATATVRAVIARAYYSADHDRLARFCDVLKTGLPVDPEDQVAVLLNQFLLRSDGGRNESARRLKYAKTQWALLTFLQGRTSKRLCGADSELFALPEQAVASN